MAVLQLHFFRLFNKVVLQLSPSCLASGSGSEEEDDEDEEESSSQSEGAEEEGDEGESVTGSERSEQSAGKTLLNCSTIMTSVTLTGSVLQCLRFNTAASSFSEDVSEDEQSEEDFEEERENGNHIPAGGFEAEK